ncbi:MAG: hypothetical protein WHX53_07575, partial [Anaerolineae bacterium]
MAFPWNDTENTQAVIGRVLRASTTRFTVGCQQPMATVGSALPAFGALVRAGNADGSVTYGLVGNIAVEDDPFVRQLVAAGIENEEYIADQRQRRQVPVAVDVLVVGWGNGLEIYHRLPPHPPGTLDRIFPCTAAEVVRFTERHDWLRLVLAAADLPADALAVAALRFAAEARPPDRREL